MKLKNIEIQKKGGMFYWLIWGILTMIFVVGCCDRIKSEADDLKIKHQKCTAEDTCVIVNMYDIVGDDSCLGSFQCSISLNKKDITSFKKEAKELTKDFEKCDDCTQASCIDMTNYQPFCNKDTSLCDAVAP